MDTNIRPRFIDPQQPPHTAGRVAVIDIGSSMVRLVVYEDVRGYPYLLLNEKVWTALGKNKGEGRFSLEEKPMRRTLSALTWFTWVAGEAGCAAVVTVATAAVREAENGREFVKQVKRETGLHVEVLSGEQEARLSAIGASVSIPDATGVVADLGGGSLELCETGEGGRLASLNIGVLGMKAQSGDNPARAVEILAEKLKTVPWLKEEKQRSLLALGSGMRSIGRLYMAHSRYPINILHDYRIPKEEILPFCQRLLAGEVPHRLSGMTKAWRDVLPYRAAALIAIMENTAVTELRFATFGLREGILFTQMLDCPVCHDPLLAFAYNIATRDARGPAYAKTLYNWAAPHFPQIPARLLEAAACFSETGWREQRTYRGLTVFDRVLGGGYVSVGHRQRLHLALMAYFRHEDKILPAMGHKIRFLLSREQVTEARAVGALFRLAASLDPGCHGTLKGFTLREEGGQYRLDGPAAFQGMESEEVAKRLSALNSAMKNLRQWG